METVLEKKHCVECGQFLGLSNRSGLCTSCVNLGERNPNFKHGKCKKDKVCKVCNKSLSKSNVSGFCKSCFLQSNNPMRNPIFAKKSGLARSGKNHHFFGKIRPVETRLKMSFSHSGEKNHMYGKRFYGKDNPNYKTGKNHCKCGKIINYGYTQCADCYQNNKYGPNNPNWKDGVTQIGRRIRNLKVYKEWHYACLERDNYTCQRCGSDKNLEVHHKIPVGLIIKENNIKNSKEALDYPEFWMLEAGVTYCSDCHCLVDRARYFISVRSKI